MRLDIPEVLLVEPFVFDDERGFFVETYRYSEFFSAGIKEHFVQDNHSRSNENVLRGLHYQKSPRAQGKLVRCIHGKVFDVAVDIRKGSPTYARWVGVELSKENRRMVYVPAGFAHGFVALGGAAEIIYKCTGEYSPADDRGIIWNDPEIGIRWQVKRPFLSAKDSWLPVLEESDNNFMY